MKGYPPPLRWGAKICALLVKLIRENLFFFFGRFISSKNHFDTTMASPSGRFNPSRRRHERLGSVLSRSLGLGRLAMARTMTRPLKF